MRVLIFSYNYSDVVEVLREHTVSQELLNYLKVAVADRFMYYQTGTSRI